MQTKYRQLWKTRDGRLLRLEDMSDTHLLNCINMMESKFIYFTNRCMARNEEMDPPQYAIDLYEDLVTEYNLKKEIIIT